MVEATEEAGIDVNDLFDAQDLPEDGVQMLLDVA
jgi:hypothetical protein